MNWRIGGNSSCAGSEPPTPHSRNRRPARLAEPPDQNAFNAVATQLLRNHPALRILQFVGPDPVIRFSNPLSGNEEAVGLDFMTRPAAPYVEKAMATRATVLDARAYPANAP